MIISSFNCKNLKTNHLMVEKILKNSDITFLIEHWLSEEDSQLLDRFGDDYKIIFESDYSMTDFKRRGRPFGGRAWIIRKNIRMKSYIKYNKNISVIEIYINDQVESLNIVGVWLPFDDGTVESWSELNSAYSVIETIVLGLADTQNMVIIGDWNSDMARGKRFDRRMERFIDENKMFLCNRKMNYNDYTYQNGGYFSVIDNCVCDCYFSKYVKNFSIIYDDLNLSDHCPINVELDLIIKNTSTNNLLNFVNENKFHKFPWHCKDFCESYYAYLEDELPTLCDRYIESTPSKSTIDECIYEVNKMFIKCARKSEKNSGLGRRKRKRLNWAMFQESETQEIYKEIRKWHNVYKNDKNNTIAKSNWKYYKKCLRNKQSTMTEEYKRKQVIGIETLVKMDKRKFWSCIRNSMKKNDTRSIPEIDFNGFYKSLFSNNKTSIKYEEFQLEAINSVNKKSEELKSLTMDSFFTEDDIVRAIKELSSNKACGVDFICAEMIKVGNSPALLKLLNWIFNGMLIYGIIPNGFNISAITPIPKEKTLSHDPSCYRPISVSTIMALLYENLVRSKISLISSNNQFGFKRMSSTKHAYFVLNETLEYYRRGGSQCYVVSLDASKAFDKLWREGLFYKLMDKIPDIIWRSLYLYYQNSTGLVNIKSSKSDLFEIRQGVKQGGVLSPILFNFFINELLETCLEKNIGARLGNINVSILAYCDDLVLISPLKSHMETLLDICSDYADKWKMEFNPKKSVAYRVYDDGCQSLFKIADGQIKFTSSFIYLGLPIGNKECIEEFIINKFRKVERSWYMLRKSGCYGEYMNPTLVSFLYKQYCQSIFNYGLENLSVSKVILKELDTRQSILLKNNLGLTKYARSTPLLNALKILSVTNLYYKYKILFFKQINSISMCKEIFNYLYGSYKNLGYRPYFSFITQVVTCEKMLGYSLDLKYHKETLDNLNSLFQSEDMDMVVSLKSIFIRMNDNIDDFFNLKNMYINILHVNF